jgi:hypothetical protein
MYIQYYEYTYLYGTIIRVLCVVNLGDSVTFIFGMSCPQEWLTLVKSA